MEQNNKAEQFNYFQNHGDEEGRSYTFGFGDPDEIEPPFIIVGSEFVEEDAMIAVDRLNYILSEQTEGLRKEVERLKEQRGMVAKDFFYWWFNTAGTNTEQGYEAYLKTDRYKNLISREPNP